MVVPRRTPSVGQVVRDALQDVNVFRSSSPAADKRILSNFVKFRTVVLPTAMNSAAQWAKAVEAEFRRRNRNHIIDFSWWMHRPVHQAASGEFSIVSEDQFQEFKSLQIPRPPHHVGNGRTGTGPGCVSCKCNPSNAYPLAASPEAFRKQLSRARRKFGELLIDKVARTMRNATPEEQEEELSSLDLLKYVRWQS